MTKDRVVAGRYRLGARIGSGAMGVVWQAHDERLHRTVAVKQLLLAPELNQAQAEEARLRSMREGRIAARLSHPNAITVYDVAEHDGEPWLIMEYLPSRSLAAVLTERGALPPEEVARIGSQVASALVAAHTAGIVHRDIKPANVLLGDDGTVKITDFGISRATGDVTVTATGMLAGTPAYLAPEVAKGHEPTASSDVFSLGSTLYTAVEGHSPFGLGENTLALLYAVAAGKVTPPRQAGPLTALLMRLLRSNPAERATMSEAREGLAAVAAGRPAPVVVSGATDMIPPPRLPGPPSPARGLDATRLDARPFAEPLPSVPGPAVGPMPGPMSGPIPGALPGPIPGAMPGPMSGPMPGALSGPMPGALPALPRPAGPRPAARSGRNVRSIVLTVLAIVAAALVGILVASLLTNGRQSPQSQASGGQTSHDPAPASTRPPPASTATSPTATSPKPPSSAPAAPSAAEYENAVRQYYALLPANPSAGWELLTDRARQRSRSRQAYAEFWSRISSVEVLSTRAEDNRVAAALRFVTVEGKESTEAYVFLVVERNGRLMIDNFAQAGRGSLGPDG